MPEAAWSFVGLASTKVVAMFRTSPRPLTPMIGHTGVSAGVAYVYLCITPWEYTRWVLTPI